MCTIGRICNRCTGFIAMTTAPNAKCQRVLVLALCLAEFVAARFACNIDVNLSFLLMYQLLLVLCCVFKTIRPLYSALECQLRSLIFMASKYSAAVVSFSFLLFLFSLAYFHRSQIVCLVSTILNTTWP